MRERVKSRMSWRLKTRQLYWTSTWHCGGLVTMEDRADDFLEQIFHRHQARGTAVLVQYDRQMGLEPLHVGQDIFDFTRSRHEEGGRMMVRTVCPGFDRRAVSMSFAWTTPTISSRLSV